MGILPDGKVLVFIVDFTALDPDVADQLAEKLNTAAYICQQYPGQRKYKVYWNLDQPIEKVTGAPSATVHPCQ